MVSICRRNVVLIAYMHRQHLSQWSNGEETYGYGRVCPCHASYMLWLDLDELCVRWFIWNEHVVRGAVKNCMYLSPQNAQPGAAGRGLRVFH